jgi:hypothetical protein
LNDAVAEVRQSAYDAFPPLLINGDNDDSNESARDEIIELILSLSTSETYSLRIGFLRICQSLASCDNDSVKAMLSEKLLPHVINLERDKISNVRVAVVECLEVMREESGASGAARVNIKACLQRLFDEKLVAATIGSGMRYRAPSAIDVRSASIDVRSSSFGAESYEVEKVMGAEGDI